MITYEQALALKAGDPIILTPQAMPEEVLDRLTSVTSNDGERLHVDNDSYQFILPNCTDGISALSLPP
jgi:hypothetical protein